MFFKERPDEIEIDLEKKLLKWSDKNIKFEISEHQKELIDNGGSVGVMLTLAAELQKEGKI